MTSLRGRGHNSTEGRELVLAEGLSVSKWPNDGKGVMERSKHVFPGASGQGHRALVAGSWRNRRLGGSYSAHSTKAQAFPRRLAPVAGGHTGLSAQLSQLYVTNSEEQATPTHLQAPTCHLHSSHEIFPWWKAGLQTGSLASAGWWHCLEQPGSTPGTKTAATWLMSPQCLLGSLPGLYATTIMLAVWAANSSPLPLLQGIALC